MAVPAILRLPMVVVAAGCLISLLGLGVRSGFGLFLPPMTEALGWSRGGFALALAVQNIVWGAGQPVAGALADRFGAGRVIALGGLCYALGVLGMAISPDPFTFQLTAGWLVGVGLAGVSFSVVFAALARSLPEQHRSWAFGMAAAAASLGQFLLVPLAQALIHALGWQGALIALGLLLGLFVPLAIPLAGRASQAAQGAAQSLPDALREAGGHGGYRLLTAGFFVCGFHVAFIQVHLPAYLVDRGLAPGLGAWALALVGLFNVVGSYSAGVLGGRFSKKNLLVWIYLARAIVIALFITLPLTPISSLTFGAAMGLLWLSTVPLTSGLVAQIFGTRYMGTLFGIVFLSHQIGAFLGIWLGGKLFDLTGSYDIVWWLSVALGVAAALLHWPIDERRVARLAGAV